MEQQPERKIPVIVRNSSNYDLNFTDTESLYPIGMGVESTTFDNRIS